MSDRPQVICVPGSVAPAALRYGPLMKHVGDDAEFHLKDLEVYRESAPPADYSIEEEVEALDRFADSKSLDTFHLVAYSGGGFISLAFGGIHRPRVISLSLFEPARIPGK
ncbi:MAG: alpha/beta hydrolase, partial [Chloroflexi bacterium]